MKKNSSQMATKSNSQHYLKVLEIRLPEIPVHGFSRCPLSLIVPHVIHQVFSFAEHFGLGQVALGTVVSKTNRRFNIKEKKGALAAT
jgi:hypothetical protein